MSFSSVSPLEGMMYEVVSVDGSSLNKNIKLSFENVNIGVTGGCNGHGTEYTLDISNGKISFGLFISTLIFCPDDQDGLVIGALRNSIRIIELGSPNKIAFIDEFNRKVMIVQKILQMDTFAG